MNEFHTSKICSQCGIELVARKNTIRFYECNTCKTTGKGGTLIDLVVNKDRSAALGLVRIFTSLFDFTAVLKIKIHLMAMMLLLAQANPW